MKVRTTAEQQEIKAKERAKARVKKWSTLAEMPFQKIHRDIAKDGRVPTLRKL